MDKSFDMEPLKFFMISKLTVKSSKLANVSKNSSDGK